MKSFSKLSSQASYKLIESWNPAELNNEFALPSQDIQKEQILAIFRNGNESSTDEQKKQFQTSLHPMGVNLAVTTWQPIDIELQTPLEDSNGWGFSESSIGSYQNLEEEICREEFNPENEVVTILRQARAQAEEIILEAQVAADKVILQAQDEIDLEKKEGYQQGWNDARNDIGGALNATHALVEEVREWQTALISQGQQTLVEMVKEISQTMFGEGVNLDANALQINLNRVMESAQGLGDLNIFLNPRDARLLDPSWSEYQLLITGNKAKIIPSEKITAGGCLVKGSMGMVDGRVETQLAAIMNTFEEIRESNK